MNYSMNGIPSLPLQTLASPPPPSMGGSEFLRALRRRLLLIVLVMVAGLSGTALWLAYQTPVYSARAAILLKTSELPSETVDPTHTASAVTSNQVFTEAQVLRSQRFAMRLAEQLELITDPRFNPALVEPDQPGPIDRAAVWLGLKSADTPQDMPIDQQRAEVVERLLDTYSVTATAQHSVIDIHAEYEDPALTARIVNETARQYIEMRVDEQLADLDRDIQFMRQRSLEISASVSEQQTRITQIMLENQLLDENGMSSLLAEQAGLRVRLDAAGDNAAPRGELEARLASIESELASRVAAEIRLSENSTVLETQTSRLDAINKRLDELEAQRDTPSPSVVQISVAEVPDAPAGPNAKSTLAVAFVVFGFMAVVSVLLRESLDRRALYQDQIESLTGLQVITALAWVPWRTLRRHRAPHFCVTNGAAPGYANAVRALVSAAMEGSDPDRAPIVAIASAKVGEGKSTIAASMAMAAAMDDLRVLLVDFDVHRSTLTRKFGLGPGQDAFGEVFSCLDHLAPAIRETMQPRIDILSFRPGSRMSRRVLGSEPARQAIAKLRKTYDLVIFDTPPFLVSEEVGRLHEIVDKAILVSRWSKADGETLSHMSRFLHRSGLPVIGLAINGIDERGARIYGYLAFREDYYRKERLHA